MKAHDKSLDSYKDIQNDISEMTEILKSFGDYIAKREGYKIHDRMNAVHFYLITKFGWTLAQVREMSIDDLEFVLAEELNQCFPTSD